MRIDWEECDPESGVITQILGRSYRDHEETITHVGRELSEVRMKAALYCRASAQEQAKNGVRTCRKKVKREERPQRSPSSTVGI